MKIICIYHSRDLDGWMSAAIVKKWFEKKHKENCTLDYGSEESKLELKINSCPNSLHMLGWDYGDDIPDLSEYDKVIMVDISFFKEKMQELTNELANNIDLDIIWIDHHISAIKENETVKLLNGLRDTKFAACELTWQYFFPNEQMPEIVRLLGRYDCFGHKNTDEEQKVLEFQYAARAYIGNYEDCYSAICDSKDMSAYANIKWMLEQGKGIYRYLCTDAKQIYERAFPIRFCHTISIDSRKGGKRPATAMFKFLCLNQMRFNPINFGIDYHKEGYDGFACFWYKDGKWKFSLYNDNGEVDCSAIAKQYGGGGHKGAAGFVVDNLKDILD